MYASILSKKKFSSHQLREFAAEIEYIHLSHILSSLSYSHIERTNNLILMPSQSCIASGKYTALKEIDTHPRNGGIKFGFIINYHSVLICILSLR